MKRAEDGGGPPASFAPPVLSSPSNHAQTGEPAGAWSEAPAQLADHFLGQVLVGASGVRYHLESRVGEGGQGWVYRARLGAPDGPVVCVKLIRHEVVSNEALERFQREASVLRVLGQKAQPNPHIVQFFDHGTGTLLATGEFGGGPLRLPYTVIEYVHGSTLADAIAREPRRAFSTERAARILRHVALALDDVHAQSIVHRDLKPSNILLAAGPDGARAEIAKVTDFGLVKVADLGSQRTTALAGASLGYAPPEQYEQGNRRVSPRTDVFSFAAIAFEMLSGECAFPYQPTEPPLRVVLRLLDAPRPRLGARLGSLSPELRDKPEVVEALDAELTRAMSAEPLARQASIRQLAAALERHLNASGARARASERSHWRLPALRSISEGRASSAPVAPVSAAASWDFRIATRGVLRAPARAATFTAEGGHRAVIAGAATMAFWTGRRWRKAKPVRGLPYGRVRGLLPLCDGALLVFGDEALAGVLSASGTFEPWAVADPSVSFYGGAVDPLSGVVTLVGERPSAVMASRAQDSGERGARACVGCLAQFDGGRLVLLADAPPATRLYAVAQLASGEYAACGERGSIVRLAFGVAEHVGNVCRGHLRAIAALPSGGAVTVGGGGHALVLSPELAHELEHVQTTRDIACLAVGPDGAAWAGAGEARLLRRSEQGWIRMTGELGVRRAIVSIDVQPRRVRALCDDGTIVEGDLR